MELSVAAERSVEELLGREDVVLSRDTIMEFVEAGHWSEKSAVDYLDEIVAEHGADTALVDEAGHRFTFKQFDEITDAIALHLIDRGFQPGDFLGVQLPNWSEFYLAYMGAIKAKVIPVNFHLTYRTHELVDILGRTRAKGLLVPSMLNGFDYESLALDVRERLPHVENVLVTRGPARRGATEFHQFFTPPEDASASWLAERRPNGFDPLLTMVSSGTSGKPKLVLHIHNSSMYPGIAYRQMLGLQGQDRWAVITPVGHSTAVSKMFAFMLGQGSRLVLLSTWNRDRAVDLFEKERVTHMIGATPMFADILAKEDLATRDLSSLKLLIYGGAPMPAPLVGRLQEAFKVDIVPFYGYSEGTAHTTLEPGSDPKVVATTVGHTLLGGWSRLVDPISGEDVQTGETGAFLAKGPNIAVGYYGEPERTRAAFTPTGWFRSGDLLSSDGANFRYVGRTDDLINRGGQKIDPKEVEDLLFTHPGIAQVVLVGAPDERLGEIPVAFVVPKDEPLGLQEVSDFLKEVGLAKWKWPAVVENIPSLPINPSGKIMRFDLRDQARALVPG